MDATDLNSAPHTWKAHTHQVTPPTLFFWIQNSGCPCSKDSSYHQRFGRELPNTSRVSPFAELYSAGRCALSAFLPFVMSTNWNQSWYLGWKSLHSSREDKTSTKIIITQAQLCYELKERQNSEGYFKKVWLLACGSSCRHTDYDVHGPNTRGCVLGRESGGSGQRWSREENKREEGYQEELHLPRQQWKNWDPGSLSTKPVSNLCPLSFV